MPKFKKLIVTPGVHNVGRLSGKHEAVPITPERIREWVQNSNRLLELGVAIPAPFAHQDSQKNFPLPVVRLGDDGASLADAYNPANGLTWDAQVNGGFWDDKFEIDPETGGLVGVVDTPGDLADPTTPAGKVGKVVRETSVLVMGPRTIRGGDGQEHQIGEHLAHVAMCIHPVQAGQRNFEPVSADKLPANITSEDLQLAMSFAMSDLVTSTAGAAGLATGSTLPDPAKPQDPELTDTIGLLASVVYVSLPPTTTREDFITNLNLCLRQKSADQQEKQKEEESLTQRPMGADTKSPTIAMSQALANGFTQVPATPNNGTPSAAAKGAPNASDTMLVMLMSGLVKDKKKSLADRIAALVASGRCPKVYADTKLLPQVEAFAMSAEQLHSVGGDSSKVRASVEDIIEALEQTQPLTMSVVDSGAQFATPEGTIVQQVPEANGPELTDAEMDQMVDDAQLQYA